MKHYLAIGAVILSYYAISGMATTNIMRLLKGETAKQNDIHCKCGNCGHIIPLYNQFPIFSYFLGKGKCKYCGSQIPILTTIIEAVIFFVMTLVSAIFSFRPLGVVLSFVSYEIIRIIMIVIYGRRSESFWKEYLVAFLYICLAFILVLFMSLLVSISA